MASSDEQPAQQVDAPRTNGERLRAGIRRGVPFGFAVFAIAISFGVLARPVMGAVAPIVMSIVVFSGAAQFGSLAVLVAGGGVGAAMAAGILLNARYLAMGVALAPSLHGGPLSRAAFAMTTVDASWAAASTGDGTFDPWYMAGASAPQYVGWVLGTVIGVLLGPAFGDPRKYGLDALFPAFFVALLFEEVRGRRRVAAAAGGAAIALVLTPILPPGVPILAAAAAAVAASRIRT
jgi:4-azaleucine resistance transporter AzlC